MTSGTSRLAEEDGLGRVEAEREVVEGHVADVARAASVGVLDGGQGVVVGDEVEALALRPAGRCAADRAEVVAEVQVPRGLDAGEDAAWPP